MEPPSKCGTRSESLFDGEYVIDISVPQYDVSKKFEVLTLTKIYEHYSSRVKMNGSHVVTNGKADERTENGSTLNTYIAASRFR